MLPPPGMDQGATVLVVEGPESRPRITPIVGGGLSQTTYRLGEGLNGRVPLEVRVEASGEAADRLRHQFAGSKDPRPFATWLQRSFPGAELTADPQYRLVPSRDPAVVELEAVVPRTALESRGGIATYPGTLDLATRVVPTGERSGPLLVAVRPDLEWTLEVTLGRIPSIQADTVSLTSDFGSLKLTIEIEEQGYRVNGYVHLEPGDRRSRASPRVARVPARDRTHLEPAAGDTMKPRHLAAALCLGAVFSATTATADWWAVQQADADFDLPTARREALATVAEDPTSADAVAAAGWWLNQIGNLPDPEEILTVCRRCARPRTRFSAGPDRKRSQRPTALRVAGHGRARRAFWRLRHPRSRTRGRPARCRTAPARHGVHRPVGAGSSRHDHPRRNHRPTRGRRRARRLHRAVDHRARDRHRWLDGGRGERKLRSAASTADGRTAGDSAVNAKPRCSGIEYVSTVGATGCGPIWRRGDDPKSESVSTTPPDMRLPLPVAEETADGSWADSEFEVEEPPAMRGLVDRLGAAATMADYLLAATLSEYRRDPERWRDFIERAIEIDPESPWPRLAFAWYWVTAPTGEDAEATRLRAREHLRSTSDVPTSLLLERGLALRERREEDHERILDTMVDEHLDDVRVLRDVDSRGPRTGMGPRGRGRAPPTARRAAGLSRGGGGRARGARGPRTVAGAPAASPGIGRHRTARSSFC